MPSDQYAELSSAHRSAGLRPRLLAFALDYLLIAAYALALAAATFLAADPLRGLLTALLATPASRDAVAFVTVVLPVILYFALQEGSARQGTWGKRKLGLRVTALDGGQLPLGRAFARALVKSLPWQVAHTCLFHIPGWPLAPAAPPAWVIVGFALVWLLVITYLAMLGFSKSHRTPYDRLAGSQVLVKVQPADNSLADPERI